MKGNTLRFLLLISLVFNIAIIATAGYLYYSQQGYWTSPFGLRMKKDRFLFEELSLSPEQTRRLRESTIPFRAEIDRRRSEIDGRRQALVGLLAEERPDVETINAAIAGISRKQEEMQRMIVTHMIEVKSELTREQQKRFLDLIEGAMNQSRQAGCPPLGAMQ